MPAPRDLHPLLIALLEAWARRWGWDPEDVWTWLGRTADPPEAFVAGAVEAFFPLVRASDFGALSSVPNSATIGTQMEAQTVQTSRRGRKPTAHPFTQALADRGITVTEWAQTHKVDRQTVKTWYVKDGRRIPREWADRIERELDVPATRRTWRNGIREA